jgi:hypothetical protein
MSPYRTVNVQKLVPGDTLVEPVFGDGLTKLLGAGCAVNDALIARLAGRGVTEVVISIQPEGGERHARRNALAASNGRPDHVLVSSRLVEHICQCGFVVAIHPPVAEQPAATWVCKSCGNAYFGSIDATKTRGVELLECNDSCTSAAEDQEGPANAPLLANGSTKEIAATTSSGRERREQTRYSIGVEVVAVPLHANFSIAGPAVRMTTHDISSTGIALSCARFTSVPYFALDFTTSGIELLQVLLRVLRVSNNGPNYEVAGKFVNRLHCAVPPLSC